MRRSRASFHRLSTKYGNQKVTRISDHAGYSFASKAEAELFDMLKAQQDSGEISDLACQVCVYLTESRILYKPDFAFTENGQTIHAEMKGFETDTWRIKRRLWKNYGPGPLRVYKKANGMIYLAEEIIPKNGGTDEAEVD